MRDCAVLPAPLVMVRVLFVITPPPPRSTLFPSRRSSDLGAAVGVGDRSDDRETETRAASRTVARVDEDRKSTRLNSSHTVISYAVFCLKKKKNHRSAAATVDDAGCRRDQ